MDMRYGLTLVNQISAHEAPIRCIAINPITNSLVSGSSTGEIKLWDMNRLGNADSGEKGVVIMAKEREESAQNGVIEMKVHCGVLFSCWEDGKLRKSF
jgi:WD40 repeat protein